MVVDAVRTYMDAASGLTELSRKRAVAAARKLIREDAQDAGDAPEEGVGRGIQVLAADLIATSQGNRDALHTVVRAEVAAVLADLDVVPRADYDRLARRTAELERRLASLRAPLRPAWEPAAAEQPAPDEPAPDKGAPEEAAAEQPPSDQGTAEKPAPVEPASAEAESEKTEAEETGEAGEAEPQPKQSARRSPSQQDSPQDAQQTSPQAKQPAKKAAKGGGKRQSPQRSKSSAAGKKGA